MLAPLTLPQQEDRTMKSELHQRLRAARTFADLSQQEVAKACNVTRPAVSQWEALELTKRTTPSLEQVKTIARLCNVPLEWLTDDEADPDSVWGFLKENRWTPAAAKPVTTATASRADFLAGLRFELTTLAVPLVPGLSAGGPDWASGDRAVAFVLPGEPMEPAAGRLLISPAQQRRMVFVARGVPPQASTLQQALAIETLSVGGISDAAKTLIF